jgi:nucleoside-diphosphate-sugar epimerase
MGYLSTTSVYGDHDGAWVDELAETRCARGSAGDHRLAAEREWLALEDATGGSLAVHAFRLAGIYGPGRSALDTVTRAGAVAGALPPREPGRRRRLASPPLPPRYVSRIHIDDICAALLASMRAPRSLQRAGLRVVNLADDVPAPRGEVMGFASSLLGLSSSTVAAEIATDAAGAAGGQRARRRATEHKRVSNARMRTHLLPEGLAFPSYREGLWRIHHGTGGARESDA